MHEFVRPVAAALSVVCLAAAIAIAFAGDALAQANQAPPQNSSPLKPVKQMALTDKQIEGVLAAQKDMEEITAKLPDNPTPDKITAQLAQVKADKKMSPSDKKEALAELNDALKAPVPPIENKGNIDLVAKYYDKLADALGDDQE